MLLTRNGRILLTTPDGVVVCLHAAPSAMDGCIMPCDTISSAVADAARRTTSFDILHTSSYWRSSNYGPSCIISEIKRDVCERSLRTCYSFRYKTRTWRTPHYGIGRAMHSVAPRKRLASSKKNIGCCKVATNLPSHILIICSSSVE